MHAAKILADSVSPDGVRLTTLEVTFPRIVLAEFNTHRVFSRNSASSRAIPVEKMIRMVQDHPYVPTHWGKNQRGMQADEELSGIEQRASRAAWYGAMAQAVGHAKELAEIGVHKQITNRLLEPFMWHTAIISSTEWMNFFHLRCHRDAHPEIRRAAELMREAMDKSVQRVVNYGDWHTPLVEPGEAWDLEIAGVVDVRKVSVGRCARVSYLTHEGKRDPPEDIKLFDRLLTSGHMSPFEHVARPLEAADVDHFDFRICNRFVGNFRGWVQYRKMIPNEHDVLGAQL
jgi:thymidylate synthase ThyX